MAYEHNTARFLEIVEARARQYRSRFRIFGVPLYARLNYAHDTALLIAFWRQATRERETCREAYEVMRENAREYAEGRDAARQVVRELLDFALDGARALGDEADREAAEGEIREWAERAGVEWQPDEGRD